MELDDWVHDVKSRGYSKKEILAALEQGDYTYEEIRDVRRKLNRGRNILIFSSVTMIFLIGFLSMVFYTDVFKEETVELPHEALDRAIFEAQQSDIPESCEPAIIGVASRHPQYKSNKFVYVHDCVLPMALKANDPNICDAIDDELHSTRCRVNYRIEKGLR